MAERPPNWQNWGPARRRRWRQANRPTTTAPTTPPESAPSGPYEGGLPLSGMFEYGRRGLEDAYAGSLASIAAQRGQVMPMMNLRLARLATDEARARELASANLGSRNLYGSGVGNEVLQELAASFDRPRQDLSIEAARLLSELAQAEGEAGLGYTQGMTELLLQLAAQQATNPSLAAPRRRRR